MSVSRLPSGPPHSTMSVGESTLNAGGPNGPTSLPRKYKTPATAATERNPRPVQAPDTLYADDAAEGIKADGPYRSHREKIDQTRAIAALTAGMESVLYAVQYPDGTVKIGCTTDFAQRLRHFRGDRASVLGFREGYPEDEAAIHRELKPHRERGWEYYRPTSEVLAVVNGMRDRWDLPHVEA